MFTQSCFVLGTVLSNREILANKIDKVVYFQSLHSSRNNNRIHLMELMGLEHLFLTSTQAPFPPFPEKSCLICLTRSVSLGLWTYPLLLRTLILYNIRHHCRLFDSLTKVCKFLEGRRSV